MSGRAWITAAALLLAAPLHAAEVCEQDDDGLQNGLSENLVVENARSAEEYLNGLLNHFFKTNEGVFSFSALQASATVGDFARAIASLASTIDLPVTICNEIGQCVQGNFETVYAKLPDETATSIVNSIFDFLSGGEIQFRGITTTQLVHIIATVTMPDGSQARFSASASNFRRDSADRSEMWPQPELDDPAKADKRCRDNEGDLTEEVPMLSSDGGRISPDGELASNGSWIMVQTGWQCSPDATGVVCRRVYTYIWVEQWA